MKNLTIAFLFLLSFFSQLSAQEIEGWINSRKPLLYEKLYLHVDRELYAVGDRIWLKAYEVNGITHQLNSNLRNIFVQLVAEDGRVVKDRLLFSANGQAIGDFKTDSLNSGMYTIRAFTKYLKNFGEEAYFHKKIWITTTLNSAGIAVEDTTGNPKIELTFLPEGGNMVLNAANTVAFKAIDSKGRGIYATGRIMDDLGDTIVAFSTSYRGMGTLMMMPVDKRTYYAIVDRHPELKIELPRATPDGISLSYKDLGEFLQFTLSSNMKMDDQPPFYFMASHKGTVVYKEIEMYDFTQTVTLDKKLFPNGISKITLLDTLMRPFAERLIFVDDGKPDLIKLQPSKQEYKPREKVTISADAILQPGDSIKSTLSVTVVNKSYFGPDGNSQNIKSYLLLDSELKGAIESPASYFVNDKFHTSAEKLDLLMLVHGWRSYLWDDIEKIPQPAADDWNDAGLDISGHVKKLLWKEPVREAEVSMDYVFRNFCIGKAITDQNGRFLFKHTFIVDTLKVMLNTRTKNGTSNAEIILDALPKKDSVVSPSLLSNACFSMDLNPDFNRNNSYRQMKELEFSPEKETILLEGVDIVEDKSKAWGLSAAEIPWADRTLTLTKDDYNFRDMLDYLTYTVPGFREDVDTLKKGKRVYEFWVNLSKRDDIREVRTIRLKDVERIDIWDDTSNTIGIIPNALQFKDIPKGKILVYLKLDRLVAKYDDYVKGRIMTELQGFNMPVKFYSPQYTLENINNPKPDYRPTLFWEPELKFEHGTSNIDFYTSDELVDYVVFVEGISKEGKICYGTTSFTVK